MLCNSVSVGTELLVSCIAANSCEQDRKTVGVNFSANYLTYIAYFLFGSDSKRLSIGRNIPYSIMLPFNAQNFHVARKRDTSVPLNPLKAQLNSICHFLALLVVYHIFHVSGLRVNVYDVQQLTSGRFIGENVLKNEYNEAGA